MAKKKTDKDHVNFMRFFAEKMSMQFLKKNLVLALTFLGLLASFGAPIGYYLHSFLLRQEVELSFWEQIIRIHEHDFKTILYIGLGSNIFFSLFGALTGILCSKLLGQHEKVKTLQDSKNSLLTHLLLNVRRATTLGIEGLSCLKNGVLSEQEKNKVLSETIKSLRHADDIAITMLTLRQNVPPVETCTPNEIMSILERVSIVHDIDLHIEWPVKDESEFKLQTNPMILTFVFNLIIEWSILNEVSSVAVKCKFHQKNTSQGEYNIAIYYDLKHQDLQFNSHIIREIAEQSLLSLRFEKDHIIFTLPAFLILNEENAA